MICLLAASKLFHTRGPATAKLPSPRVVRVRGTASVLQEDERRWRRPCSETSWMSADKYVSAVDVSDWCARHAILNSTRLCTGRQWSSCKTGITYTFAIPGWWQQYQRCIHYHVLFVSHCSCPATWSPSRPGRNDTPHRPSSVSHVAHASLADMSRLAQHAAASLLCHTHILHT